MIDFIYNSIDSNDHTIAIFIDYQKAFDTINRDILLQKLEKYGIRGTPLNLISSYLTNRFQFTKINGCFSFKSPCKIGVPQGTILAPILFILYINDMHNISNHFSTILFADDTTLLFRNSNFHDLLQKCSSELNKFRLWTIANRLSLNVDKTCAIVFSNRPPSTRIYNFF